MKAKFNFEKYKAGTLTVELTTKNLERFINLLLENEIEITKVKKISVNVMYFNLDFHNYGKLKKIVTKTESRIRILDRQGMLFLKLKIKRRIALVLGVFLFCGVIFYLSTYIWQIDITTEKNVSPYEIRAESFKNRH